MDVGDEEGTDEGEPMVGYDNQTVPCSEVAPVSTLLLLGKTPFLVIRLCSWQFLVE